MHVFFLAKDCIHHFLLNIQKEADHLSDQKGIEVIICLLCILKDSAIVTNVIIQDFNKANGYEFLQDFILAYVFFYLRSLKKTYCYCFNL